MKKYEVVCMMHDAASGFGAKQGEEVDRRLKMMPEGFGRFGPLIRQIPAEPPLFPNRFLVASKGFPPDTVPGFAWYEYKYF